MIQLRRYLSTYAFVSVNNLTEEAEALFGRHWVAEDDVNQIQELCDKIAPCKYIVEYVEGLDSDIDINVREKDRNYIDSSRFIEVVGDLAKDVTEERFGEFTYEYNEEGKVHMFTDEAQDFFNDKYDEIETMLNVSFNTYNSSHEKKTIQK